MLTSSNQNYSKSTKPFGVFLTGLCEVNEMKEPFFGVICSPFKNARYAIPATKHIILDLSNSPYFCC